MNKINIITIMIRRKLNYKDRVSKLLIIAAVIIMCYFFISIYFSNHFLFNTTINGVNVSLKAYDAVDPIFMNYVENYKLTLIERNGATETLTGQDIDLSVNDKSSISEIYSEQKKFLWGISLFKHQNYYVMDLYAYNEAKLKKRYEHLVCVNCRRIEPQNVRFQYSNGSYEVIKEIEGNKIKEYKLKSALNTCILKGLNELDLNEAECYENPNYTLNSEKTNKTKLLLNEYVSAKITYLFGNDIELVDGNIINKWLIVDEDLDVKINKTAIRNYIKNISSRYDTVGIDRKFKTSLGKIVEVKGGLYGWKINQEAEIKALQDNILSSQVIEKEPIYEQKAFFRGEDEIGNTYVEINITRQHLWFYKEGKLIVQGFVVTGNPNRGYATVLGTYMLNYKQKGATLTGPGYEAPVTYWMPFYGNIGLHDASWRSSFGGEIYKRRGSHGCVNAPLYLAETIYQHIEAGVPIVIYEE